VIKTDSPQFYFLSDNIDGNELALTTLKKMYVVETPSDIEEISVYIKSTIQKETSKVTLKAAFFSDKRYTKASWVNIFHIIFHELTGINSIMIFSNTILANITEGGLSPRMGTIAIGAINFVSAAFSFLVVRAYGRRPLLLIGHLGIAICHGLVGLLTIY
jgi:hypothetical protein